jgi:histone acetyltransferase (RNA polymerase elongator complex component)
MLFCDWQLDYCKLYPCLDLPYTKTREWKESGEWKPMAEFNFPVFMEIIRCAKWGLRHALLIVRGVCA